VTIGDRGGDGNAAVIGNHVLIGAGAKIIGEIKIGSYSIIGANAVVTEDMDEDTIAYGNPAIFKLKGNKEDKTDAT
jgi:serine O-acetyltransferase